MSRLLFWIGLAVLVVMAIRSKLRAITPKAPPAARRAGAEQPAERMTSCAQCGLYFPASEALRSDGRDYCCPAHVRQRPR